MRKSEFSIKRLTAAAIAVGAALTFASGTFAAQLVTPVNSVGTDLSAAAQSVPSGGSLTVIGRYSVSGSQTANETGIGLKLKYDAAKFSNVVVNSYSTKCAIAPPQVQANGASSQVVMGWIDSSIRAGGAVGWPGTADVASPSGCLEISGITQDDNAKTLPYDLFSVTFTTVAGFGTASIQLASEGQISFANAGNVDVAKTISLTQGGALACNLDVDGNGSRQAFVDGILLVRNMLNISGAGYTSGVTIPAGAARTNEADIKAFIATNSYDIDGNGNQQAFVDGIILARLMLNVPDATLLNGVTIPAGAAFTTAAAIRANVNSKCGTSF
jgi:hypothetical protein